MRTSATGKLTKVMVLLAMTLAARPDRDCLAKTHDPVPELVLIGHRGLGRAHPTEPENDLRSLVRALEGGAAAVEFDVQLAKDGEVVLAHDERLERTSEGAGCVAELESTQLARLSLRDGSGRVHEERRMPTLRDALAAIRPFRETHGLVADIHVKVFDGLRGDLPSDPACPRTDVRALTDRVIEVVAQHDMTDAVLLSSFDPRVLDRARFRAPSIPVALISYISTRIAIERASRSGFDAVVAANHFLDDADIAAAHRRGLKLFVWFPDREPLSGGAASLRRADGFISDHPLEPAQLSLSAEGERS